MLSLLSTDMKGILPTAIILVLILTCFLLELSDLQEQGQDGKTDWVGPSVIPTEAQDLENKAARSWWIQHLQNCVH